MSIPDGRKSMSQEIEHIRVNNPDYTVATGEFIDNDLDWGGATKVGILFMPRKIAYISNGKFDKEQFKNTWTQRKDDSMSRYEIDESNVEKLGKFNAGSTESVFLIGEHAVIYHNFEGSIHKTVLDLESVRENNTITPNSSYADKKEIKKFVELMKIIIPDYDLKTHANTGTVCIVGSLLRENSKKTISDIQKFTRGLIHPTREHTCCITLINNLSGIPSEQTIITEIEPTNMGFGAQFTENTIYTYSVGLGVYEDLRRKYSRTLVDSDDHTLLYKFKVRTYFLNKEQLELEQKIFGSSGEDRTGFHIYRGGRKLTGIDPKRWRIPTGESRAKGIRIELLFPVSQYSDEDLSVGTFKKITDDSWRFFNEALKELFINLFKDINSEREKIIKEKRKQYALKFKNKIIELDTVENDIESLTQKLLESKRELEDQLNRKDIIKKKAGEAYNAHNNYILKLIDLVIKLTPPEPEPALETKSEPEHVPEPESELEHVPEPESELEHVPELQPEPEPAPEPKPESKPEPKPESKPEPKPEAKPEPKPEPVETNHFKEYITEKQGREILEKYVGSLKGKPIPIKMFSEMIKATDWKPK